MRPRRGRVCVMGMLNNFPLFSRQCRTSTSSKFPVGDKLFAMISTINFPEPFTNRFLAFNPLHTVVPSLRTRAPNETGELINHKSCFLSVPSGSRGACPDMPGMASWSILDPRNAARQDPGSRSDHSSRRLLRFLWQHLKNSRPI